MEGREPARTRRNERVRGRAFGWETLVVATTRCRNKKLLRPLRTAVASNCNGGSMYALPPSLSLSLSLFVSLQHDR